MVRTKSGASISAASSELEVALDSECAIEPKLPRPEGPFTVTRFRRRGAQLDPFEAAMC